MPRGNAWPKWASPVIISRANIAELPPPMDRVARNVASYVVALSCMSGMSAQGVAEQKTQVHVRCGNACRQGVPFPQNWQTALTCQKLAPLAENAAKDARDEICRNVDCKLLGIVRGAPSASSGDMLAGSILALETSSARIPYILCAPVCGSTWLCHRGSFEDGNLDKDNPLNEKDLVI